MKHFGKLIACLGCGGKLRGRRLMCPDCMGEMEHEVRARNVAHQRVPQ